MSELVEKGNPVINEPVKKKRRLKDCICCHGRASFSYDQCKKGCVFDVCVDCLLNFSRICPPALSIDDVFCICFFCREKIFVGRHNLQKLLQRREKFICVIKHEAIDEEYIIFKNNLDKSIGFAEVIDKIDVDGNRVIFTENMLPPLNTEHVASPNLLHLSSILQHYSSLVAQYSPTTYDRTT